jgi:hypothetical protein
MLKEYMSQLYLPEMNGKDEIAALAAEDEQE